MNTKVKKRTTPKNSEKISKATPRAPQGSSRYNEKRTPASKSKKTISPENTEKKLEKSSPVGTEDNFGIPNLEIEELSFDASLNPIHYTVEEETSPKSSIILGSMQPVAGFKPEILAPAGDKASFLAGLAAGADAAYVGLKKLFCPGRS